MVEKRLNKNSFKCSQGKRTPNPKKDKKIVSLRIGFNRQITSKLIPLKMSNTKFSECKWAIYWMIPIKSRWIWQMISKPISKLGLSQIIRTFIKTLSSRTKISILIVAVNNTNKIIKAPKIRMFSYLKITQNRYRQKTWQSKIEDHPYRKVLREDS